MTRRPRAAALTVGFVLLLAPVLGLFTALPAAADASTSTITCPGTTSALGGAGGNCPTVVTSTAANGTVAVTGNVTRTGEGCSLLSCTPTQPVPVTLQVTLNASGRLVASASDDTYNSVKLQAPVPAGSPNGTYTATLKGDGANVTVTFDLDVPPAAPTNVNASGGVDRVTVSWTASTTPDVSGYGIYANGTGQAFAGSSDCSGTSCADTLSAVPGTYSYTVTALRPDGQSDNKLVESAQSTPSQQTTVSAPPPTSSAAPTSSSSVSGSPSPSTQPTGTSSASGSPGTASSSPGATTGAKGKASSGGSTTTTGSAPTAAQVAQQAAAQQQVSANFQAFSPPAGIAQLPPLPQLAVGLGSNPDGEPTSPGTYKPTLSYPNQKITESYQKQTLVGHFYNAVGGVFNSRQIIEYLAGALIIVMLAGHLRAFARRQDFDSSY